MPQATQSRRSSRAQGGAGEAGSAQVDQSTALVRVEAAIDDQAMAIARLLPETVDWDRFRELTLREVARDPKLLQCSPVSLVRAVTDMAKVGLEPVLGEAYLVPFWSTTNSVYQATMIIGYPGLQTLAFNSGLVTLIEGDVVYEKDEWRYVRGYPESILRHVRLEEGDRGKAIGAWAMVWLRGSDRPLMDFLPESRIEQARKVSRSGTDRGNGNAIGIWATWHDEMRVKTALRHVLKLAPKSVRSKVVTALAIEDAVDSLLSAEAGAAPAIAAGQAERSRGRKARVLGRLGGKGGAAAELEGDPGGAKALGSTESGGSGDPASTSAQTGGAAGRPGEPDGGPENAGADPTEVEGEARDVATDVCGDASPYGGGATCGIRGEHKVHKQLGPKGEILATWPRK